MRFKVEPKDFLMFIIYSIFLLYLCAIAVLNFSSIANTGEFYGLLPFKAFTGRYLPVTILLFILSMVVVFTSVSSYIFEKDNSGSKFLTISKKKSDGYSKWAKESEIKKGINVEKVNIADEKLEAAGIPLINNGKEVFVDNGDYHNLVIGSTGSGKTQTIVKPMVNLLSKKGESMIISDPKGEIYHYAADFLRKQDYNVVVLNFRDPEKGNAWNPLSLPYQYYNSGNVDKATELLNDIANNIFMSGKAQDPFWEQSSSDYFSGLALGLFMDTEEKYVNLNSINLMSTVGEERLGSSTFINEYFKLKGEASSPYIFASNTINSPNETKGGILSTFRQKIRIFSTQEKLSEMLSHSDFDMRDIGKKKTAVFIVIHDEKKTYHSLMTIFIKQCYETLIAVAQECKGGKLPFRTNFILDEFANMPKLNDVDSMVSAARSRDIRFTFIIQNFAQLTDVYGKEVGEVIRGNCGNLVYLISTELAALEEISKMCGEVKSKEKDKTASTPLVTVSDLQKLKLFEAIIIRLRTNPFQTKLTPDFKIDWGIERVDAEFPTRELETVQLFDVKKFVNEERAKKMQENAGNMRDGNNMGMNPNPFSMFGNSSNRPMPNSNPFLPSGFNSAPNVNPNPFMQSSLPQTNRPINSSSNPFGGMNLNDLDLDKMMADIDKKIKELEEEEEREKQKSRQTDTVIKPTIVNNVNMPKFNIEEKKELPKLSNEVPTVNVDRESKVVKNNVVTDDEFFDDFFYDE
ncbi:MAG: type IV secretory system conjugative DNA transfer family protein [Bacilli bacterium]|nr:type IV secretory system conjugative DNA transfer family protein [Bacilli bacterium]